MPEPWLYLQAMGAAAIVSLSLVLLTVQMWSRVSAGWLNVVCLLGIGAGLACGDCLLSLRLAWPPVSGRDRLWLVIVPAVFCIEAVAGFPRVPRWNAWTLRLSLIAAIPGILLSGSVYLNGMEGQWELWQSGVILSVCSLLLAGVWIPLAMLSARPGGAAIPLAVCLTTQCGGLAVMMAGYIGGGAAAFPWTGATLAALMGILLIRRPDTDHRIATARAMTGVGVAAMFGMLFIGRFFGELPTGSALTMLLAPLLCLVTEWLPLRHRQPWLIGTVRLLLVAIPLIVVLLLAKLDFDREMAPLLENVEQP
ncbi:MAG: hypothetical protein VB858_14975, partial [Planctomycetaceae bacterium]